MAKSSRVRRSEIVLSRITTKLKQDAVRAAKIERRTLSSFIEGAIIDRIVRVFDGR
jgi:uncharacterized protein (DUF1778 family)